MINTTWKWIILTLICILVVHNSYAQIIPDSVRGKNEHLVMATAWYRCSAEVKAIYIQTYRYAYLSLDEQLKKAKRREKKAVITDIDETILDNSPFEVQLIKSGEEHSKSNWKQWTVKCSAKPLPGAVDFFNYARSRGVEVFYVSNRGVDELAETMKNLEICGFPYIDENHFLLKTTESGKEARRQIVEKNYRVLLLLGDNLCDFSEIYENRDSDYGFSKVENEKDNFGYKYIIFPNPMYGDWEKALYNGTYKIPSYEKNLLRKKAMEK